MSKKILFAMSLVALLCLALPAMAFPPQCSCTYCTLHGNLNCTIVPGNTVVNCGDYYVTHCSGPNLVASAVPSRADFLASLAPAGQPAAEACATSSL